MAQNQLDSTVDDEMLGLLYPSIRIGPLRVDSIGSEEFTGQLMDVMRRGLGTHHVVTANAQFYNLAEQRSDFRECLDRAEFVCADGISLVFACKCFGEKNATRVAGVDLVQQLCAKIAQSGLTAYFLGGNEGSARMAAEVLQARYPGLEVVRAACPPYGFEKDPEILRRTVEDIRLADPSVIFVALGAPRQELFIQEHIRPLGVPVAVGVGGSFEMIAGRVRRAPEWIRGLGLEWAYRWSQEPARLTKRYLLGNTLFVVYLFRHLLKKRLFRAEQLGA
jgi:N-acetylglucosaminyldiphosphoundecaprenol N-acetyl-beta-D-mannosaminyltransferase